MFPRKVLSFVTLALSIAVMTDVRGDEPDTVPVAGDPAIAQQDHDGATPRYIRPETPDERRARLSTSEDPGIDPDPAKIWWRFGKPFTIQKFERRWARYLPDRPGWVRPFHGINVIDEIYQQNDEYVWVWMEEVDREAVKAERAAAERKEISEEARTYLRSLRAEFTPLRPQKSDVRVRFEKSSEGLPTHGNFRNSLAVADMNGDGFPDLVLPPQRSGDSRPSIYLGDGKGSWKRWDATWPDDVIIDYGSVVAADFNKDGRMDVAVGIHLRGVAIFYGDGKGNFRLAQEFTDFPTRRLRVADVDADGWPDVVAISEGPMPNEVRSEHGPLRAYINPARKKGQVWEGRNIAAPREAISGDWLAVGNFNGDKYPDFIGSTVYFGATRMFYVSDGSKGWVAPPVEGAVMPFYSYYGAVTAGPFTSRRRDDAIIASFRIWPSHIPGDVVLLPPLERVVTLDRISFTGKEPVRTPIMRWKAGELLTGLNRGDFDGDGHLDIVFTHTHPRELFLLLGDGAGTFRHATAEGIELSDLPNYDLEVADVDGDGRPDIIIMWSSETGTGLATQWGGVDVFLNRGPVAEEQ